MYSIIGMDPHELKLSQRYGLLILAIVFFSLGLIQDTPAKYFQIAGWPIFIYLMSRLKAHVALLYALMVNLAVSLVGTFWIEYFGSMFIIKAVLFSCWVLPAFCALGIFLSRILAAFKKCKALAWLLAFVPIALIVNQSLLYQGFFTFPLPLLQILFYLPHVGMVFLMLCVIAVASSLVFLNESRINKIIGILGVSILVVLTTFGLMRFSDKQISDKKINVVLAQHNYPFIAKSNDFQDVLIHSAAEAAAYQPDLIVFPLYNLPQGLYGDFLSKTDGFFNTLARNSNSSILIASNISEIAFSKKFSQNYRVMAALYNKKNGLSGLYHSVAKSSFHDSHQILASEYSLIIDDQFGKIGSLLSYEIDRRDIAQKAKKLGATLLICMSNPGDSKHSPLPYLQWRQVQMRAIETGLPVLTVTPNGFSGYFDARGRVRAQSALGKAEILQIDL